MDKEKIQLKVDKIKSKIENNRTLPYYILTSICVIGVIFFLSSNLIFNKELSSISTELNKEISFDSVGFELKDRKYNPDNGLVQFTLKVKNPNINNKIDLSIELREKTKPTEIVPSTVVQVTNSDYIVYANVNYKWKAISLTIKTKEDIENVSTGLKLYSDIKDITIDDKLVEKNRNEYTIEIIGNEIKDIKSEIERLNKIIEDKNSNNNSLLESMNNIESEMKYQTESEIEVSKSTIQSQKSNIESSKNEIENINKNIAELEEKIIKLEEKKKDF